MRAKILIIAFLAGLSTGAWAEEPDPAAGQALVDRSCQTCHHSEVYTRGDRRIQNLGQLRSQVSRCEQNLGLKWFETDVDNVTAYLNQAYYRF